MDYAGGGRGGGGGGGGGVQAAPMHHHMSNQHQHPPYQYLQHQHQHQQHNMDQSRMQMQQQHDTSSHLHANPIHQHNHHHHQHNHHQQQQQQEAAATAAAAAYYDHATATATAASASQARHSLATPSTPSQSASPRFARPISPLTQSRAAVSHLTNPTAYEEAAAHIGPPEPRHLPPLDAADDDNFDQAYAHFILYCNPSFALDTDVSELKRIFRTPPKSDGKAFSTYHLFQLLKRLDAKDIKTWTDLALELGVERPNVEKGQSSQKVQQYSVRLKRWMRALHIDAFFEYLMGKKHAYYLALPPLHDPFPDSRDGVPIEEDLAIRAIDPKFRPKRGRRRADEVDGDDRDSKRLALDSSFRNGDESAYPMSAYPMSAVPGSAHPDFGGNDPWASLGTPASALPRSANSQTLRWRNETPSTPHPLSAVTPMSAPGESVWGDEPLSAITPSSARSGRRRRHGPAVSSAWPSTNTTVNGKLRGRPPSNRSVRDGPFVTFPANPKTKEAPLIELSGPRQPGQNKIEADGRSTENTPTPSLTDSPQLQPVYHGEHHFLTPQLPTPISAASHTPILAMPTSRRPSIVSDASSTSGRPERLQLQVPRHVGGPVHLVTPPPPPHPPPTLLVNGIGRGAVPATAEQTGIVTARSGENTGPTSTATTGGFLSPSNTTRSRNNFTSSSNGAARPGNDNLKRGLVASLLKADVQGRPVVKGRRKKLGGSEARSLADAILLRASSNLSASGQDDEKDVNVDVEHGVLTTWLGLGSSTATTRKVIALRSRIDRDGFESPVDDFEASEEGGGEREGEGAVKEIFDVEWTCALGGIEGNFAVRGLELGGGRGQTRQGSSEDESGGGGHGEQVWRERFLRVEAELQSLRDKVLDAVV